LRALATDGIQRGHMALHRRAAASAGHGEKPAAVAPTSAQASARMGGRT
jgi:hydroxymethylglutaryl-CoA reductase